MLALSKTSSIETILTTNEQLQTRRAGRLPSSEHVSRRKVMGVVLRNGAACFCLLHGVWRTASASGSAGGGGAAGAGASTTVSSASPASAGAVSATTISSLGFTLHWSHHEADHEGLPNRGFTYLHPNK